ncbi:kinase-like protein, partial [Wolfiporia cocos MD-104 SS10]
LSQDLAKGLTFIHKNGIAHLDIKPANLVYTDEHRLQIIDFDIAVQVKDEDDLMCGYLGTEGWMAPEIGKKDGPHPLYSPIRADRWSCGRVFLVF